MKKLFLVILATLACAMAFAQNVQVNGTVTDAITGEALSGAVVQLQGSNTVYSMTGDDGRYSISVPSNGTLTFTLMGYTTATVPVAGRGVVNVTLSSDQEALDELVVIGYGTMRKRDLTGAISSVKSEDIVKRPTYNVMEALQGQVAGLDIIRTNGDVNKGVSMVLRGNRSINGSNTPLFIIDGMEGSYSELNPADIASVEVLKDASSTAIYGSAGANGVVIITTKSPQKGKFSVNLDAYHGVNRIVKFPETTTGEEYINFRRLAMQNAGMYTDDANLFPSYIQNAIDAGQWVDWAKELARVGTTNNYNISSAYANDRIDAYMSVGYYDIKGIQKTDGLKRYSARAKVDFKANDVVKFGLNLYGMYSDADNQYNRPWNKVLHMVPLGVPYDEFGNVNPYPIEGDPSTLSPIADLQPGMYVDNTKTVSLSPQAYVELTPLKGLSFKSVLGGYFSNHKNGLYSGTLSGAALEYARIQAQAQNSFTYNYKWQNILTYSTTIADAHDITTTGVIEWTKNQYEQSSATANGFDSDNYQYFNLAAGTSTPQVSSSYTGTQMMSYIGRVNYSYLGRYLASVSARYDGASVLAEGHKWALFPAGSLGWRVSDEPWFGVQQVNNLKLRASYGVTGNAGASAYATQDVVRTGAYGMQDVRTNYSGYSLTVANKGLGWEKSYTWDVGLDLGMWNDRVNLEFDWYRTHTTDLLYEVNLPYAQGGYGSSALKTWANVGETLNRGIEITLNTKNIVRRNFSWTSTLTFARNREEVLKTTQETPLQFGSYYLIPGQPIQTYYTYKYLGIWGTAEAAEAAKYGRSPGQVKLEDVPDENGNVDYQFNQNDYQVIGHNTPDWTAGFTNTFNIGNFDLSVQMLARWGWTMFYGVTGWYRQGGISSIPTICDYWTETNQTGRWPAPNAQAEDNFSSYANWFDGSYIKIKNASLGYTFPGSLLDRVNIKGARVYVTASDPLIWTKCKYIKDYDPEKGGDDDDTPLSKQVIFGINITF